MRTVNKRTENKRTADKRIVIRIGAGSIQTGYGATVQIGEEGLPPQAEMQARLPAAPDLPDLYQRWQRAYRQLGLPYRLEAIAGATNVSNVPQIEQCRELSRELRLQVHHWLNGEDFRPIREKVLEQLSPQDTVRILLQTSDPLLQRLPWYDLDFFQRYRQAEVGICLPCYQQVNYQGSRSKTVRVLAVLGDATGLDTQADCALLSELPRADVTVLHAPTIEVFTRELWDTQGWDILFFAGHSQ
ncbi:MAG: sensor protein Chase2, partial [Cyanobacteria bacterium J06560_2]